MTQPPTFSTAELSDAHPEVRACLAGLRHFGGTHRFCGRAVTVRCYEDNGRVREALEAAGERQVLVVDGGESRRCALLGDQLGALAVRNGWSGIVVAGCVRDSAALAKLPLGIMALDTHPRRSQKQGQGLAGVTVTVQGVSIAPGEYLYGDEDGLIVALKALA